LEKNKCVSFLYEALVSGYFLVFLPDIKLRFMRKIAVLFLLAGFWSCTEENPLEVDISNISAKVEVVRFDTLFYGKDTVRFREVKRAFPYLFPSGVPDSAWTAKMQDTLFADLNREVKRVFPAGLGVEKELENLFKHIKYYFPGRKDPKIITLYSDWDYMKRVYLADTLAFLFLDNYLGKDNPVYEGIPVYIRQTMSKEYIPVDFAARTAEQIVPYPQTKDFLSKMVYYGKILYLQKAFLPQTHDSLLLGYSSKKWRWATENEASVWLYFLDNNLLFDTDKNLNKRFLDPSPFSKFYSDADNESAGMIGRYIGYQIVKAYMKRTGKDLKTMLQQDANTLFNRSKYKP
jgi:gliding motility-associated lipoprotein GldB